MPRPPRPFLLLAVALALLLRPAPVRAAAAVARLAASFAAEVARAAQGRPVELAGPEDRTGQGLAADFAALVVARLRGKVELAAGGRRIEPVLSRSGARLVVSARVLDGGTLVDVLSVSTDADDAESLSLAPVRRPPAPPVVQVAASSVTTGLERTPVDLAFLGADRLIVLFPDAVALYRFEGSSLQAESRSPLAGPFSPVRAPGGLLAVPEGEGAFWTLVAGQERAQLFGVQGGRLVERDRAVALPWPGQPAGVRFVPGTNLLQADLPGARGGPLLRLLRDGMAVTARGTLAAPGASTDGPRVGSALAKVWPGLLAASGPEPPGAADAIVLVSTNGLPRTLGSLPVEGSIRALAAHRTPEGARLVVALQTAEGSPLLVLDLRPGDR